MDLGRGANDSAWINSGLAWMHNLEISCIPNVEHYVCILTCCYFIKAMLLHIVTETSFASYVLAYVIMFIKCNHRKMNFAGVKMCMNCSLMLVKFILWLTLSSILFSFSLLHAWVSMVSINLCNPCDQGRVDITIENMYFYAGNKLKEFISSLSCIHIYMFAKLA